MAEILTKSKKFGNKIVLVDDEDYEYLNQFKWVLNLGLYARARIDNKWILMHRLLMNALDNHLEIDHIDRNTLNNRKENLRFATRFENNLNTEQKSGKYKGVSYLNNLSKWQSCLVFNGEKYNIGLFDSEDVAARAYDQVLNYFAENNTIEFAYFNFPKENIQNIVNIDKIINYKNYTTSKYVGVVYSKKRKKFQARIFVENKCHDLGFYLKQEDAAKAYNKFIIENRLKRSLNEIYNSD